MTPCVSSDNVLCQDGDLTQNDDVIVEKSPVFTIEMKNQLTEFETFVEIQSIKNAHQTIVNEKQASVNGEHVAPNFANFAKNVFQPGGRFNFWFNFGNVTTFLGTVCQKG